MAPLAPFHFACMGREAETQSMGQMQPKLAGQGFVGERLAVLQAALLEQGQVELVVVAGEDMPGQFDIAIGRDLDRRRYSTSGGIPL